MTTATMLDKIEAVIEQIRPAVRADGGDVELVSFDPEEGRVELRLVGACHGCPSALLTLKGGSSTGCVLSCPKSNRSLRSNHDLKLSITGMGFPCRFFLSLAAIQYTKTHTETDR